MRRSSSSSGFSLVELLVVVAFVAALGAVAISTLTLVRKTADLRTSFMDTAVAIKRKATSAVGGDAQTFVMERDAVLGSGLTINPKYIAPPSGTEQVSEIAFEGGTGNARVGGRRAVVSIVVAEEGNRDLAHAIVAGTGGRVELVTYSNGQWRRFE